MGSPKLRKVLLGYSTSSVQAALADRERVFERAIKETESARARAAEAQADLDAARSGLIRIGAEVEGLQRALATAVADAEVARAGQEERDRTLDRERASASRLQGELETARQRAEEAESLRSRTERELTLARSELVTARGELTTVHDALASARSELTGAHQELTATRAELESTRRELIGAETRADSAETTMRELQASVEHASAVRTSVVSLVPPASQPNDRPTAEDLVAALRTTEDAISRVARDARVRAEEEVERARRERTAIEAQVAHLRAWRDRMAPLIEAMTTSAEGATQELEAVRSRIELALRPTAETIARLTIDLRTLGSATGPDAFQRDDDPSVSDEHAPLSVYEAWRIR